MPRKAFLADLQRLSERNAVEGISDVCRGEDDGHVVFNLSPQQGGPVYSITAIVSDPSDYPNEHCYFLSTQDDAPKDLAAMLERMSGSEFGLGLEALLEALSRQVVAPDPDGDLYMPDSQASDDDFDEDDVESVDDFNDDVFESRPAKHAHNSPRADDGYNASTYLSRVRIRSDLRAAKEEGFKVGALGGLLSGSSCHVSVSCRISKLGISEEAMQAWQVDRNDYLTLLIQYQNGYKTIHDINNLDSVQQRRDIKFAVRINDTYKPSLREATAAFNIVSNEIRAKEAASQTTENVRSGLRDCFISRPLDQLLNDRLLKLVAYRQLGMPWSAAERFYDENQGKQCAMADALADEYLVAEEDDLAYPSIVTSDHLTTAHPDVQSFPLVAMQFLLRHFVRCSEFCLVCHCRTSDDLGAIKPYVCDKPLCLYQYMSLGFGPSIEHEIMTQPHVVDLLISFCYAASCGARLEVFPLGLGLQVPPASALPRLHSMVVHMAQPYDPIASRDPKPRVEEKDDLSLHEKTAKFNEQSLELIFDANEVCPVRVGDWIIIYQVGDTKTSKHCRVASVTYFPTVAVSEPVVAPTPGEEAQKSTTQTPPVDSRFKPVKFAIYDQNFDHLNIHTQREVIFQLLDLLPSIQDLQQYIKSTKNDLSQWIDRIPPALAGLVRWIIASSRACILQEDDLDATEAERESTAEKRLHGMPGYMQFRFAMGAPDKERRFIQAVNAVAARLKPAYPTIFAWHGSPLGNWHSIIREGLHYKYVASGRAFGDGCYHSMHFGTSSGYSGMYNYNRAYSQQNSLAWPQSRLKIQSAMALSEIVNAPDEFQSRSPHLVVQHLDWIQTRYLFVRCDLGDIKLEDPKNKPKDIHPQDPVLTPQGAAGTTLIIPAKAINRNRRTKAGPGFSKIVRRFKGATGQKFDPVILDDSDDTESVKTLQEDLDLLEEETGSVVQHSNEPPKGTISFIGGKLDISSLPLLQPPSYATSFATKRLLGDFSTLIKLQNSQPAHQLGWYVNADPDLMNNLYQWIVELHSFDASLPLVGDMKKRGINSVVLEIRFGKDFPISPPFVRVVRPRFLGFQQGGGGHVTLGGAICMELLTNNGWTAACTIDSVLLQIKLAMESTDPRPARLAVGDSRDYGIGEAVEAFERACRTHGWVIPSDLRSTTQDMSEKDTMADP